MSDLPDGDQFGYDLVITRLHEEFGDVHGRNTVRRCIDAARDGARDVIGDTSPDLVERIARRHLQVLATVAAENG